MAGETPVEDGVPVGFRWAVFEGAGVVRGEEVGAIKEGFSALG